MKNFYSFSPGNFGRKLRMKTGSPAEGCLLGIFALILLCPMAHAQSTPSAASPSPKKTSFIKPAVPFSPGQTSPSKNSNHAGFTDTGPMDFNNHDGYASLFDGVSLKGWDGNPKFWSVKDGAIMGEATKDNPCGNTYLVYRGFKTRDFDLKFEMKIVGSGGSGMQYRSQTGVPWPPFPPKVEANVGPVTQNLQWMMTGPQADFWPAKIYSGQFYSENTPMRIVAYRGQAVECSGTNWKELMGNIGDRNDLGKYVNKDDWNQYTVIARGGTCIQIMNGQVMAVLIDDDPNSSNNQAGYFGIELESITELYVRNIWAKKLD
jgi:hypothetical protein